jgi:hypothetical protein
MKNIYFGLVLLLAIMLLSACAGTQEFPTGDFYESTPGGSSNQILLMADELYFSFSEDGTFEISNSLGNEHITGTYSIEGDKYTEVSTDLASCSIKGPATYKWTFDGTTLKFFGIGEDKCVYRTNIMEGRVLIRRE